MFNINVQIFNVNKEWYPLNLLDTKHLQKVCYQTVENIQKYVFFFVLEKLFSYNFVFVWRSICVPRTKLNRKNDKIGGRPRRQSLFDMVSLQIGKAFQRSHSSSSLSPEHKSPKSIVKSNIIENDLQRFVICKNERQSGSPIIKAVPSTPSEDIDKSPLSTGGHLFQPLLYRRWRAGSVGFGGESKGNMEIQSPYLIVASVSL